jgi:hypothetical protein
MRGFRYLAAVTVLGGLVAGSAATAAAARRSANCVSPLNRGSGRPLPGLPHLIGGFRRLNGAAARMTQVIVGAPIGGFAS